MKKYLLLLVFASPAWAVTDVFKQSEDKTLEEIVADTFTDDEFIHWVDVRDRFNTEEKEKNDKQLTCVTKGKHPKQCVDPDWCLYPSNEKKDECVKYNIKKGIF